MKQPDKTPASRRPSGLEENLKKALTELLILFLFHEKEHYIGELSLLLEERSKGALSIVFPYAAIYRLTSAGYLTETKKRNAPDGRLPFYCDYGSHIEVGKNFFANYNCTIIDVAKVKIGDNCQMAPNVAIYTAGHPIYPDTRNSAFEYGKEVTIGDNVWLGGNSVVCPGVHIGDNVVIGAGSVVTKDIPDWSIATGNPCRVLRKITDNDKRKLFHDEEIDDEAWNMICVQEGK